MQFLSLLAASVAFATARAAGPPTYGNNGPNAPTTTQVVQPGNQTPNWCTAAGYPGDRSCENAGLHTYCCSLTKRGEFTIWRDVKGGSTDGHGSYGCPNFGIIQCA